MAWCGCVVSVAVVVVVSVDVFMPVDEIVFPARVAQYSPQQQGWRSTRLNSKGGAVLASTARVAQYSPQQQGWRSTRLNSSSASARAYLQFSSVLFSSFSSVLSASPEAQVESLATAPTSIAVYTGVVPSHRCGAWQRQRPSTISARNGIAGILLGSAMIGQLPGRQGSSPFG